MDFIKKIFYQIPKPVFLFIVGGIAYNIVEILFRGYTFPSMFILGGLCFVLIGGINEYYPWTMPLPLQMLISAFIVTTLEFVFGVVLNVWLGLGIWDYSNLPFNLMGQISLIFSIAWFFLSLVGILLDDVLRWVLYNEEKPRYYLWFHKRE